MYIPKHLKSYVRKLLNAFWFEVESKALVGYVDICTPTYAILLSNRDRP